MVRIEGIERPVVRIFTSLTEVREMENEKEREKGQANDDRKPYETPTLTKFGNVAEVTQGVLAGGTDTLGASA